MKKLPIAFLMLITLSIASFAQTQPSPSDSGLTGLGGTSGGASTAGSISFVGDGGYSFNYVAEVERKLPVERASQLRQASEQIQQRQREIEVLQLQARIVVLESALELGLTKAQFEQMELSMNEQGELVFKPKPKPGPLSPSTSMRQSQPPNR